LKFWGHIPQTPWEGAQPPPPPLPTLVGLGFASVLGPTRGRLLMWANRPFFWFRGGTPPTAPRHGGLAPLDPPFAHPRGLRVCRRFGPPRGGVANVGNSPPLSKFWGHIPHAPWEGAAPPPPPVFPPSLALGSPAFWVPLVAGVLMGATRPLFQNSGGTSPTPPGRGLRPLHPLCSPSLA
jgi:hypothetical protein